MARYDYREEPLPIEEKDNQQLTNELATCKQKYALALGRYEFVTAGEIHERIQMIEKELRRRLQVKSASKLANHR